MKLIKFIIVSISLCAMVFLSMHLVLYKRVGAGLAKKIFSWSRGIDAASLAKPPLGKTEAEKQILQVLDPEQTGISANVMGRLLRILVEAVDAKNVVEIGTAEGHSSLWICLALQSTRGKLFTFEIDPGKVALARKNFRSAGVENFATVVEGDAHETIKILNEPIDLIYIDAEKAGYLDYLNKLLPLVRPGGLILADNVNRPELFPDFIAALSTNPDLDTVGLEMFTLGISLSVKKR